MKTLRTLRDYRNQYNQHVEKITCLQRLIAMEEQKLFALIKVKKLNKTMVAQG